MNNIEYIKNWFLIKNQTLEKNPNKEEILHILTTFAVAFAKIDEIENEDEIILNNGTLSLNAGVIKNTKEMENILNIINYRYGYLEYNDLIQMPEYAKFKYINYNGILNLEKITAYFNPTYKNLIEEYKNYDFNKRIYKINNKVFFCDQELNEKEYERLYNLIDDEQKLYEVFHDDNGNMRFY